MEDRAFTPQRGVSRQRFIQPKAKDYGEDEYADVEASPAPAGGWTAEVSHWRGMGEAIPEGLGPFQDEPDHYSLPLDYGVRGGDGKGYGSRRRAMIAGAAWARRLERGDPYYR